MIEASCRYDSRVGDLQVARLPNFLCHFTTLLAQQPSLEPNRRDCRQSGTFPSASERFLAQLD